MEKVFIKNRKDQKLSIIVESPNESKGLAFVMHGLGGFKEQKQISEPARLLFENGYTVVRFDTTNSIGESGGEYENASITSYYADLEDVLGWAEKQPWYQEPYILAGHSLGGICIALFAQKYPEKVKALAPISTVVSGKLSMSRKSAKKELEEWERTGWKIRESKSKPGLMKKLPWSHMEDRLKYDLLENTESLTMPVLLVVGSSDDTTPVEHQKKLFEALPGLKELHIIEGGDHSFRVPGSLGELSRIFDNWIKNI